MIFALRYITRKHIMELLQTVQIIIVQRIYFHFFYGGNILLEKMTLNFFCVIYDLHIFLFPTLHILKHKLKFKPK